jgi:hypothetical protein
MKKMSRSLVKKFESAPKIERGIPQIFSDGDTFIISDYGKLWIAHDCSVTEFRITSHQNIQEASCFGQYAKFLGGMQTTELELKIIMNYFSVAPYDTVDINNLLFKNKSIQDLLKVIQNKIKERKG